MRKSTIFLSAVLTTFALVVLYRVASAYNDNKNAIKVAAVLPTSLPAPVATDPPAVADALAAPAAVSATVSLGPVDAAQLAAKVIGNTSLLSAETSNYNGVPAYLITFTNNDVVYVGMDGQILSVQAAPPTVAPPVVNVVAPPVPQNGNHSGGGSHSSGGSHEGSGGEHEGGDD